MTSEFSDHNGDSAASCLQPAERGSAGTFPKAGEDAKDPSSVIHHAFPEPHTETLPGSNLSAATYNRAMKVMQEAVVLLAVAKNAPLSSESCDRICQAAILHLGDAAVLRLLDNDSSFLPQLADILHKLLDMNAAMQFIERVWRAMDFEQLDRSKVGQQADAWTTMAVANDVPEQRFRWPDIGELVEAFGRANTEGPVAIRMPVGQNTHRCLLDRKACRAGGGKSSSFRGLLYPVIRCPGLPGTPNWTFPDGRCVKKFPDGTAVTTYWRNGVLDRDPKEGPAQTSLNADGTIENARYFVEGIQVDASGNALTEPEMCDA